LIGLTAALAVVFPEYWLCVTDTPRPSDVIIVLGGDFNRAKEAALLFQRKLAPKILISGAGDWPLYEMELIRAGVPPDAIEIEDRSHSTRDNACFSSRWLSKEGVRTAVLVTSWFHTRRARQSFLKYTPDVVFHSVPVYRTRSPGSMGMTRGESKVLLAEYAKTAGYIFWHGIFPVGP
jgi:uncharacterized SAM-binding protein YcdF (DUF218 family)